MPRQAHNLEIAGSNPAPATLNVSDFLRDRRGWRPLRRQHAGPPRLGPDTERQRSYEIALRSSLDARLWDECRLLGERSADSKSVRSVGSPGPAGSSRWRITGQHGAGRRWSVGHRKCPGDPRPGRCNSGTLHLEASFVHPQCLGVDREGHGNERMERGIQAWPKPTNNRAAARRARERRARPRRRQPGSRSGCNSRTLH